jgi:cytochrome P450
MMPATQVSPELARQLRRLLAKATPVTVHGGVLIWWGTSELPNGTDATATLDQPAWEGAYLRLQNGALSPTVVPPLLAVLAKTSSFRPDGPLPIAIARFRFWVPRPELITAVREAAADGTDLRDPPSDLEDALEERHAFFACGLLHEQWGLSPPAHRGREVTFAFDEQFHLTNPGEPPPDAIEIDPGDGGGFRPLGVDSPVSATYRDGATAKIALRCRYGAELLSASFAAAISDQPAAPPPDEIWPLRAPSADGRVGNAGTAYVYRASGRAEVSKPLIMVEGFPGGHPCDYLYDTLDQQGTASSLRAGGYDVVIVGLDNGLDEIQRNAEVLIACIRQALERTHAPLVVGGLSMGGLVSRYALAQMEAREETHNTRVFLTIDTPHGGTYTSLGAQWFVHAFRPLLPALAGYAELLDSPANQQFDLYWLHEGSVRTSPLREAFLRELEALGDYPQLPRRLAVSSGRGDGARDAPAGAETMSWAEAPFVSATLRTLSQGTAGVVGEGSFFLAEPPELPSLSFAADVAWEGAPGGQEPYNGEVAALAASVGCGAVAHPLECTCTVPTVSALGLSQDPFLPVPPAGKRNGAFDDYAFSAENEEHLTITPEVSAWLLAALDVTASGGDTRTAGAGVKIETRPNRDSAMANGWSPEEFNPHDPAFLADPYPTYKHFRDQAPIHRVGLYESDWMFRYADCEQVLTGTDTWIKNPPCGASPGPGPLRMMSSFPEGLFASDPPLHTLLRKILEPLFTQTIQSAPALAAKLATPLLDSAREHGRIELISDYALPLPAGVFFTLLGIPHEDGVWEGLIEWQAAIAAAHDVTQSTIVRVTGATCSMALNSFFEGMLLKNRSAPGDGLFGKICEAFSDAGLSPQEVQMCACDFLVAGYLSTTFIIGTGVRNLLLNPRELASLREGPQQIDTALEEMLRFDGPVQVIDRFAATDTEVGGRSYPKGSKVTAVVGAADHDPSVFDDPETFLIDRAGKRHLSFGAGIHACIGAPLVRLVGPVAINMLLAEFPGLAVDGLPQWQTDPYLRAVTNLPLRLG